MNGKQLKNSILQWAIQGKLVPQDPNDEPASVLLKRIREEKAKLVKEKKIKKDKNESIIYRGEDNSYYEKFLATGEIKCIDEEIPFEIPQGWEWERIGNLFETTSGSTPLSRNPDYYKNGNINWVRTTDLNNGILNKTEIKITAKACSDYNLSVLPQTSVCVAMYGGAGTIGKHCILHFDTTINQSVCAIQPNVFCNMNYIHTFIEFQRPYWMDFAAGSRKDPNINQLIIKHCLLPIPPQEEQLRIVSKLNQLYPYINQYETCQNKLDQINKEIWYSLRKSILQEAIQGKLVPQIEEEGSAQELIGWIRQEKERLVKESKLKKSILSDSIIYKGDDNKYFEKKDKAERDITEEIPFDIPSTWAWVRLSSITDIIGGYAFQSSSLKEEQGKRVIRISDISEQGFVNTKIVRYNGTPISDIYRIQKFDIIMAMTGGTVGKSLFVRGLPENELLLNQRVARIRNLWLSADYLNFVIIAPHIKEFISKQKNSTNDNISMADISNFLIPLPPIKEQLRIVEKLYNLASIMSR